MNKKGQVAIEMLSTLGIALVIILGLMTIIYTYEKDNNDQIKYYKENAKCFKIANIIESASELNNGFEYMKPLDFDVEFTPRRLYISNESSTGCEINVDVINEQGSNIFSIKKGYMSISIINGNAVVKSVEEVYVKNYYPFEIINTTSVNLTIITNIDSTCKADTSNKVYDSMLLSFSNNKDVHTLNIAGLVNGNNEYYIKCKSNTLVMNNPYIVNLRKE